MNQQFKFSIIMSVYKVEDYIEEAVESVFNQDIGFKKNIQLIFLKKHKRSLLFSCNTRKRVAHISYSFRIFI